MITKATKRSCEFYLSSEVFTKDLFDMNELGERLQGADFTWGDTNRSMVDWGTLVHALTCQDDYFQGTLDAIAEANGFTANTYIDMEN